MARNICATTGEVNERPTGDDLGNYPFTGGAETLDGGGGKGAHTCRTRTPPAQPVGGRKSVKKRQGTRLLLSLTGQTVDVRVRKAIAAKDGERNPPERHPPPTGT